MERAVLPISNRNRETTNLRGTVTIQFSPGNCQITGPSLEAIGEELRQVSNWPAGTTGTTTGNTGTPPTPTTTAHRKKRVMTPEHRANIAAAARKRALAAKKTGKAMTAGAGA